MVERIRDATVAEAIAAEAGTEETPELVLGDVVSPVIQLQQRPPLASSGYFPGTMGVTSPAAATFNSHVGIFAAGVGGGIVRVNWAMIMNTTASARTFTLRRLDTVASFPSVRLIPGYIDAGNPTTGAVFSIRRNDTVGCQGVPIATFALEADTNLFIPGPWILNSGGLILCNGTVNDVMTAAFGYEHWPRVRAQAAGG